MRLISLGFILTIGCSALTKKSDSSDSGKSDDGLAADPTPFSDPTNPTSSPATPTEVLAGPDEWQDQSTKRIWHSAGTSELKAPPKAGDCVEPSIPATANDLDEAVFNGFTVAECAWINSEFHLILQAERDGITCETPPPPPNSSCGRGESVSVCSRRIAELGANYRASIAKYRTMGTLYCFR